MRLRVYLEMDFRYNISYLVPQSVIFGTFTSFLNISEKDVPKVSVSGHLVLWFKTTSIIS